MAPKQMTQAAIAKLVSDEVQAKAHAADRKPHGQTGAGGPGNVEGACNAGGPERAQQARDLFGIRADQSKAGGARSLSENIKGWALYSRSQKRMVKGERSGKRNGLMEQKVQGWKEKNAEQNKRKWEGGNQGNNQGNRGNNQGDNRDNHRHNQNNNRRNGGARAMTQAQGENVNQGGHAPKCNRCNVFHFGNCPMKCNKYGKRGHIAKDCRGKGVATGANTEPIKVYYKCRDPNHLANSELCPEKKKLDGRNAGGHIYAVKDVDQAQGPNVKVYLMDIAGTPSSRPVEFKSDLVSGAAHWSPVAPINKRFEWGADEDEAFQKLKQDLCTAPILALPEGPDDFVVYCDASLKGYGALLSDYGLRNTYHPGKANVVADALAESYERKPLRVRLCDVYYNRSVRKDTQGPTGSCETRKCQSGKSGSTVKAYLQDSL
ncbi:putative reverse transcriptase domain-containing protein [Tanacetum coccineum]